MSKILELTSTRFRGCTKLYIGTNAVIMHLKYNQDWNEDRNVHPTKNLLSAVKMESANNKTKTCYATYKVNVCMNGMVCMLRSRHANNQWRCRWIRLLSWNFNSHVSWGNSCCSPRQEFQCWRICLPCHSVCPLLFHCLLRFCFFLCSRWRNHNPVLSSWTVVASLVLTFRVVTLLAVGHRYHKL